LARPGATPTYEEESELAWRSAIAACVVLALGQIGFGALSYRMFGLTPVLVAQAAHVLLACIVLVALLANAARASVRMSVVAFVLLWAPFAVTLWLGQSEMAEHDLPWSPFTGHKLVMVALAVMMPGAPAIPILLILVTVGLAFSQYFLGGLAAESHQWAGEPWVTGLYATIAVFLVGFRAHHRDVARHYARARAQTDALTEMSRFFLALRDLQNTPIQTLEIDTAILERRHPESATAIKRMRRSIAELRDISRRLSRYDRIVQWETESDRFDPQAALEWLERMHDEVEGAEASRDRRAHREHA